MVKQRLRPQFLERIEYGLHLHAAGAFEQEPVSSPHVPTEPAGDIPGAPADEHLIFFHPPQQRALLTPSRLRTEKVKAVNVQSRRLLPKLCVALPRLPAQLQHIPENRYFFPCRFA